MIKRESYFNIINEFIDKDFIKIFTGIRRSGKTTLLHSIIDVLKEKGVKKENIYYFSFESIKYQDINNSNELNELILGLCGDTHDKIYLLFDEIQLVTNWEKSINGFYADLNCDIYLTGSNSMLLSGEYATLLSGRYIQIEVYPFSFKEFLQYCSEVKKLELTNALEKELFDEYLEFGGMPGILELNDKRAKKAVLKDIYASIVYNDIFGRYPIKKMDLFKRFANYIMNKMGETFSSKSITNYLKNNTEKTSRNTILNFTNYLENAYFISMLRREDIIGKKILSTQQKYYLMDHGFHNALESNWTKQTHVLENIVYIELLRRGYDVKIGKIYDKEIDFLCKKDGNKCYIQVTWQLSSPETIEREMTPLLKVRDQYDKYVFSMDEHDMSQKGIKHKNIIEFLKDDDF